MKPKWVLAVGVWLFVGVGQPSVAAQSNVVERADEAVLRAALDAGGNVRLSFDGTVSLGGTLTITKDTVLDGLGHAVVLSGQNAVRVFTVSSNAHLTLVHLTVANGRSDQGGGLYNDGGTVSASNCIFTGNQAVGRNGTNGLNARMNGVSFTGSTAGEPGIAALGGAIYNRGNFWATNCLFTVNSAVGGNGGYGGGGVASAVPGYNMPIGAPGGQGNLGAGGAVYSLGAFVAADSTFRSNLVSGGNGGGGGSGYTNGVGGLAGKAQGGGIWSGGTSLLVNCTLARNQVLGGNGGRGGFGDNMLLFPGLSPLPGAIGGNAGRGYGGALHNLGALGLSNCTFRGNVALGGQGGNGAEGASAAGFGAHGGNGGQGSGGAIFQAQGELQAGACLFDANQSQGGATGRSFALTNLTGLGGLGAGGSCFLAGGIMRVSDSTFVSNFARGSDGWSGATNAIPPAPPAASNSNAKNGGHGADGAGGAIFTAGDFIATNCTFRANQAEGADGGHGGYIGYVAGAGGNGGDGQGGACYQAQSNSQFWVCQFEDNWARGGAGGQGGYSAVGDPNHGRVGNSGGASGGCLFVHQGQLQLLNCRGFTNGSRINLADGPASGHLAGVRTGTAQGGVLFNRGTAILRDSWFERNQALGGAGLYLGPEEATSYTDTDPVDSGTPGGEGEGGVCYNLGHLLILGTTFANNTAAGGLGGRGQYGGAATGNSPTTLRSSDGGPGGPGGRGFGGGLANYATVAITNATFYSNSVAGGAGGAGGTGGVFTIFAGFPPTLVSTRYASGGNGGPGGDGYGGAIGNSAGEATLLNCTVAFNWATAGVGGAGGYGGSNLWGQAAGPGLASGGGIFNSTGTVSLVNSLLASNRPANALGQLSDGGHNLSSDTSCSFPQPTSFNNVDPRLGPLANYGGFAPTLSLLPGSPAIDGGDSAAAPATDQRGLPRPIGRTSDIGAFENMPLPVILPQADGTMRLQFILQPNRAQVLQATTDFLAWLNLSTNQTDPAGLLQVLDADATKYPYRFYRTQAGQ